MIQSPEPLSFPDLPSPAHDYRLHQSSGSGMPYPSVSHTQDLPWWVNTPVAQAASTLAFTAAAAADDRKGENIIVVQVSQVSYLADYFVVVSGFSPVQVRAIAQAIEDAVEQRCQRSLLRKEGLREGRWVLQDFGDVVVHIFMPQERDYYNLEAFWGHGERIPWSNLAPQVPVA